MPRLKPPVEWGRTANLARRQISSAREPGLRRLPGHGRNGYPTVKPVARCYNRGISIERLPAKKVIPTVFGQGFDSPQIHQKRAHPNAGALSFDVLWLKSNPSYLRHFAPQIPRLPPSYPLPFRASRAGGKGSGATVGSTASIPRRSKPRLLAT